MFKESKCIKCSFARWTPPDESVGIMGPTLEDCKAGQGDNEPCPFGNIWTEYLDMNIDESEEELELQEKLWWDRDNPYYDEFGIFRS